MKIRSLMALTCAAVLGLSTSIWGDTSGTTPPPKGPGEQHITLRLRSGTQQPPSEANPTPTNPAQTATTEPSTEPLAQAQSETPPTPTSKPDVIGLETVTVPSSAALTQTHAVQPLRTVLGFELESGLKYPVQLAIQKDLYKTLPVGKVLIDAIIFKDQTQKHTLLIFSLRKVSKENFLLLPMPLNIVHQTKEGGLFCLNPKNNKLAYYNGFLLQTEKWKDLKVSEHLVDNLVKSEARGDNVTIKDEITFDFVKKENPIDNIPILWEAK